MTLTIKTTLKDLLNSRFIIIYRFSPSLHNKRAVLPAKSSKPYSPKSSLLAFWLVTSITSCASSPLICASFSATYFILRLSFLLPRLGSGAIYGLSVSRTILSIGIYRWIELFWRQTVHIWHLSLTEVKETTAAI